MKLLNKITEGVGSIIIGVLIFVAILAISWGFTIGIIALICLCFGWQLYFYAVSLVLRNPIANDYK